MTWTLDDLAGVEPTGLRVASFFSGCGGSSLGYRRAGFEVVYANEFIPIAAATYRANASASTIVDERDVRTVDGGELVERFGELDLIDGSPPCSSFSQSGKRAKLWGKEKLYSEGVTQRTDDLFDEWCRIIEQARPRAFVAENVDAFTTGVAIGFSRRIMARLRAAGYRVAAARLDAQWLGVPQARCRTIMLGLRDDLGRSPRFPTPDQTRISMRQALGDHVRGQLQPDGYSAPGGAWGVKGHRRSPDLPAVTFGATRYTGSGKFPSSIIFAPPRPDPETGWDTSSVADRARSEFPNESMRFLCLDELRKLATFPSDFELIGRFAQRWERIGRAVPPFMMERVARVVAEDLLA